MHLSHYGSTIESFYDVYASKLALQDIIKKIDTFPASWLIS